MFSSCFVCLVLFICIQYGNPLDVGDYCKFPSGQRGICAVIGECQSARDDLDRGVFPTSCDSFVANMPVVCCKNDGVGGREPDVVPVVTPTRPRPTPRRTPRPPSPYITTKPPTVTNFVNPPGIGHKARAKCFEYKEHVFVEEPSANPINPQRVKTDRCGHTAVKLIVGGTKADEREFPHMAALGFFDGNGPKYECGGTLISENFILTAAHCLYHRTYKYVRYARLGDMDLASDADNGPAQTFEFEQTALIRHPEYVTKSKYNDIALIRLPRAAELNPFVRPACLNTVTNLRNEKAIASGWGKIGFSSATSSALLKVVLDMFTNNECYEYYDDDDKLPNGIADTQLCTGSKDSKLKDACQGDSGGPLQIYHTELHCMYNIIGITSFGKGCGVIPGVYTNVAKYVDWIENEVWP